MAEALYRQGLKLRIALRYQEAGQCFKQAADAGWPAACWEMFTAHEWGGGCGHAFDEEKANHYLVLGSQVGDPLCDATYTLRFNTDDSFTTPMARLIALNLFHDLGTFSDQDKDELKKQMDEAGDNPWPLYYYASYVCDNLNESKLYLVYLAQRGFCQAQVDLYSQHRWGQHREVSFLCDGIRQGNYYCALWTLIRNDVLQKFCTTQDVAQALSIVRHRPGCSVAHMRRVVSENCAQFSVEKLYEIRFYIGKDLAQEILAEGLDEMDADQFEAEEYRCFGFYQSCRLRASASALAWMCCLRRKALSRWISRDTAKLIGQRLTNAEEWIHEF